MLTYNNSDNCIIIILGASGDLTKKKLLPALYELYKGKQLPSKIKIIGVGRHPLKQDLFSNDIVSSCIMDMSEIQSYSLLKSHIENFCGNVCSSNILYYFATPPFLYVKIAEGLYKASLTCNEKGWKRVIIEKPFGSDLNSAKELNKTLLEYFKEEQIYRIDHYLGKETVQNIFVTRFSNAVFEPLWNRNYIDYVEITAFETIGVENRAGYYDNAGALRDMIQNHLLQVLGIIAMEPPVNADANSIRDEIAKVFKSLRPIQEEEICKYVVRGQYNGYRDEKDVKNNSTTETFVAIECYIDNWRWSGVPFFIRTGKKMAARVTEVAIHFKQNPHAIFNSKENSNISNMLIIRIQPDEGMLLKVDMKIPGSGFNVRQVNMNFKYNSIDEKKLPTAYERLICDCIAGDSTLYQRNDAAELTWSFVQSILNSWEKGCCPVLTYKVGGWGPKESFDLLAGRSWREPCGPLFEDGDSCTLA